MHVTVSKWGNSAAIRLPKQIVQELQLQTNDILEYEVTGNSITLKKATTTPELTVDDLFKNFKGEPFSTMPFVFESCGKEQ